MREEARVKLTINLNGEFHIHHHHHHSPNPSQPGAADIINSIRDLGKQIMTKLDTSVAQETGDFQTLLTAIEALEAVIGDNTALKAALDAANLDAETQASILDANDAAIQAAKDKINAILNPAPPAEDLAVTVSFTDGTVGVAYTGALSITGGTAPYSVTPDTATVNGLTMDSNGAVTGTPETAGGVSFSGSVADSAQPTNAHLTFSGSFTVAETPTTV
jgi:hypothetical protein